MSENMETHHRMPDTRPVCCIWMPDIGCRMYGNSPLISDISVNGQIDISLFNFCTLTNIDYEQKLMKWKQLKPSLSRLFPKDPSGIHNTRGAWGLAV